MASIVMHLSQDICHLVVWQSQPTLEHQERSFIVKVLVTLFGELLVTLQGRIVLLRDVDISQTCRARFSGHQSRKRSINMRQGIRYKMVFLFSMNNEDNRKEVRQESSPLKLLPTQVGL